MWTIEIKFNPNGNGCVAEVTRPNQDKPTAWIHGSNPIECIRLVDVPMINTRIRFSNLPITVNPFES